MIFALLFILAFLIGLAVYVFTSRWMLSVLVSLGLFVATTLADTEASAQWGMTFVFGLPIVFVASLLGAYVVEMRRGAQQAAHDIEQGIEDVTSNDER